MANNTAIEWTHRPGTKGETWNPVVGCSIVSKGCTNCYAMRFAGTRLDRIDGPAHYRGTTQPSKAGPVWTGKVAFAEHKLTDPLRWRQPRTVFVNSMGDLFHEDIPDEWIDRCFAVMALSPQHTFQVLTKRADRMRAYCRDEQTPFRVARQMDALSSRANIGSEEVRPIAAYPGYFASSHGHIYSEKRGARRKLKADAGDQGHLRVALFRSGNKTYDRVLVHRIILETFVGPPPEPGTQGRHRDKNPGNNAASNLRWGDQGSNWSDSKRHGTFRRYSKLTIKQVEDIRRRHSAGEAGEALAREFDVSATQIRNITSGQQWAVEAPIQWPLGQCWLGISAERQQEADERIPLLLDTPAAIRFVSLEPLLGPIDLERITVRARGEPPEFRHYIDARDGRVYDDANGTIFGAYGDGEDPYLNWVIVGGESGPNARPMNPQWARSLRDQCTAAGVAFFFKQWGEWSPPRAEDSPGRPVMVRAGDICIQTDSRYAAVAPDLSLPEEFEGRGTPMRRLGKKAAGRLLDGREWNEFPEART